MDEPGAEEINDFAVEKQTPRCPMGGNRCVITGMGHHTTHSGKDWRFKSMSSEGEEDDARPAADRIATPRSDCVMESRLRNIGDQTFVATQSLG